MHSKINAQKALPIEDGKFSILDYTKKNILDKY